MNKLLPKPILIIGGMGPQASLRFHQLLIEKSSQHHDGQGSQFPFIVHISVPVDDFISDESRKYAAVKMLQALSPTVKQLQPSTITLACNTAHLLTSKVDFLQESMFLSMIDTVVHQLAAANVSKVGLLASPTTIRTKLYENALQSQGIAVLRPDTTQQSTLEQCIRSVIEGKATIQYVKRLAEIGDSLVKQGAKALLLGCTELPLIFNSKTSTVPAFDCLDIYASAVVNRYYLQTKGQRQANFALPPLLGYNGV